MAKKIVQYCYFGEDAMEAGYVKYTDPNLESSFQSLVAEKALYCFEKIEYTYLLLSKKSLDSLQSRLKNNNFACPIP